ncbi:MAG: 3-hydroxyacyl-CoA dehydrogenase NAD-binding domain-containing protein [Saprospiraceae bacterium]|nr:3-hydroxybutyryl-CoA dehydrogenase [Saprospiraceae bacterium]
MQKIAVIGCGTMGLGIAQIAAMQQHQVYVYDSNPIALQNAKIKLQKTLDSLVEKTKITNEQSLLYFQQVNWCEQIENISNCDLVIEAIIEDFEIKKQIFAKINQLVSPQCIIASNTSSLSITSLAACVSHPQRFIGIHFFNPAPIMPLVEIIPAIQTDTNTISTATAIVSNWKKTIVQAKDTPGFIVNRVARPYYGEAIRIYEEGIATKEQIDQIMRNEGGFRMGPFELMDFIGHDVNYAVTETVWKAFYFNSKYIPSFSQKRLVEAGYLGKKTGRGFYIENESKDKLIEVDSELSRTVFERILCMLLHEAADALYYKIASRDDIDMAMAKGVNYPKGLLQWADDFGIEKCVSILDYYFDYYHEERYRCSVLLRNMANDRINFYN